MQWVDPIARDAPCQRLAGRQLQVFLKRPAFSQFSRIPTYRDLAFDLDLRLIDALKTFDIIFAMTGGGPGYASETLNIMGYKYSFEYFRMGQSAVILVALFLVVFGCSLAIMKLRASADA